MAVSRIFRSWLPILAEYLRYSIVWPEKEALFFIELPLNLNARTQAWSDYKNHNTITLHEKCPYSKIFWSVFSRVDIPLFTRGKSQLPAWDVGNLRNIATVRFT